MRIDIPMPKAGLTMVEGTISEWKAAEGALIQKGDAIMEYENEKNTIEYESVHGGYLHILEAAGETVEVGRPIAWVTETKEEYDALTGGGAPAAAESAPQTVPAPQTAPAPAEAPAPQGRRHVRATGLARKMAREAGIDLADVPAGSGPDGRRVAAKDVTAYLESRKVSPAPAAAPAAVEDEITAIPWTGVRKTIARNMMTSLQQSAQCTAMCEVDVTDLLALRQKLVEGEEGAFGLFITTVDGETAQDSPRLMPPLTARRSIPTSTSSCPWRWPPRAGSWCPSSKTRIP